ncbi:MAG: hypothetical protein IPK62_01390 [Bacteroidetes bacterium]|nr:hypothetical protein [Bacteroidota bacterium]MBK8143728.1 hypothetical protein [Bacteroidota bacterium]MBP6315793.1 hypothetical protein [Chitinophagaceae bacterium]
MENTPQEPRKGISLHWIYLGIIALLVAAGIYLFVNKNKAEDKSEALSEQVETIATDKASIETEYNAALARLDEMKNESVQMDSLLTSKSSEVEELKSKINAIVKNKNATESELKEAGRLIKELKNKLMGYQEQITALKNENIQLTEEKKNLISEKNEIISEKENLQSAKKELEKTVELGAVLHASGFKLEAINSKKNLFGKEKEKETNKAKKADLMRISFDLDDNRISESGEKMIYICIKAPNGQIVTSSGNTFKTVEGNEMNYTTTKIVPYRKGEKVYGITTEWRPNSDFEKGNYTVEVYHQGYKIGNQKVSLN